jgi:hypothetical protein
MSKEKVLVSEDIAFLRKHISDLSDVIRKCRDVMEPHQLCEAFGEQQCVFCSNTKCGDNLRGKTGSPIGTEENCVSGNCWDSSDEFPAGKSPNLWCSRCRDLVSTNFVLVKKEVEKVEKSAGRYSNDPLAYASMMRWLMRYAEMVSS